MATLGLVGAVLLLSVVTTTSPKPIISKNFSDVQPFFPILFNNANYVIQTRASTWKDAQAACEFVGANLAVVNSQDENSVLANFLKMKKVKQAWIGARDFLRDGVFRWVFSNSTMRPLTFTNWHAGEPDNPIKGNVSCVEILEQNHKYAWNANNCEQKNAFICKKYSSF